MFVTNSLFEEGGGGGNVLKRARVSPGVVRDNQLLFRRGTVESCSQLVIFQFPFWSLYLSPPFQVTCYRHHNQVAIMSISITDICENTKMGREFALLGNYETALVYYQGVVQQIHRLLQSINDPIRKERWQEVSEIYSHLFN